MKGLIFTEFIEMVEEKFGAEVADAIIEESDLPSGGSYTTVGTYGHEEMVRLVTELSRKTGISVAVLLKSFGSHLFHRFTKGYPDFFVPGRDVFSFLEGLNDTIHAEVEKLYPDAELPEIQCEYLSPGTRRLTYRSRRPFGDLAEGLLRGCIEHFGEAIDIAREDLPCNEGAHLCFTLTSREQE